MFRGADPLIIFPLLAFFFLSCASIKTELPPGPFTGIDLSAQELRDILAERSNNFHSLKASGSFDIEEKEKGVQSFEGILFLNKPDKLRLQGISFGTVVFDLIMKDEESLLFIPSERRISIIRNDYGYLKDVLTLIQRYSPLSKAGVEDPLFLIERSSENYIIYLGNMNGAVIRKVWLDRGYLFPIREEIYSKDGSRDVEILFGNLREINNDRYPYRIEINDIKKGLTIMIDFQKVIINPALTEEDFKFPE